MCTGRISQKGGMTQYIYEVHPFCIKKNEYVLDILQNIYGTNAEMWQSQNTTTIQQFYHKNTLLSQNKLVSSNEIKSYVQDRKLYPKFLTRQNFPVRINALYLG